MMARGLAVSIAIPEERALDKRKERPRPTSNLRLQLQWTGTECRAMYASDRRLQLIISRYNYDLGKTFDVLVGMERKQQRFTVYHDLLTQRPGFMRAARSGRWSTDPKKPTILDDHKPQVFSAYLLCVNFGADALEEHVDALPTHWDDSEDDSEIDDDNDGEDDTHASVNDNHDENNKSDKDESTELDVIDTDISAIVTDLRDEVVFDI
jgi:hypothetical protein